MCGDEPDPTPEVNDDDVKGNNALPKGLATSDGQETLKPNAHPPYLESFDAKTFVEVFNQFKDVQNYVVATSVDDAWRDMGDRLHRGAQTFRDTLQQLMNGGGWEGESIKAAFENAIHSIDEPFYTGTAAKRAAELVHKFRDTMDYVVNNLVHDVGGTFPTLHDRYLYDLSDKTQYIVASSGYGASAVPVTTTPDAKQIEEHYNSYMRSIMNESYRPGLTDMGNGYPQFALDTTPAVHTAPQVPGVPVTPGGGGPGGLSPSSGAGTPLKSSLNAVGTPSIPKVPADAFAQGLATPEDNAATSGAQDALSQAADSAQSGLSGAAGAANQAVGGATNAAKQAMGALQQIGNKKPTLPEGVLSLGKGSGSPHGSGGGGGSKGGGASLGASPRDLSSRSIGQTTGSANSGSATPAAASRSGVSASSPGAGSPAAGSRGAGADGKEYKVSKALRNRKNGAAVASESEAVVAVVGDDTEGPQTAEGGRPPTRS